MQRGHSTHIDLYVRHNEHGYSLAIRGKSWIRSIEVIKFYNALRAEGIAVSLYDAKCITDRLLGRDNIGIVPESVIPAYCEAWFPGMEILDFMNLPYESDEYEIMLPKIIWLDEKEQKLLKDPLKEGAPIIPGEKAETTITRTETKSAFYALREQAADVSEMSLDEINAEISSVRAERR